MSIQEQGSLIYKSGLTGIYDTGTFPNFSIKYFLPIYDARTDLELHDNIGSGSATEAIANVNSVDKLDELPSNFNFNDIQGQVLWNLENNFVDHRYQLDSSNNFVTGVSSIVSNVATTNINSRQALVNVINRGVANAGDQYHQPSLGAISPSDHTTYGGDIISHDGNGVFTVSSTWDPSPVFNVGISTWDRTYLYGDNSTGVVSYHSNIGNSDSHGVYQVKMPAIMGSFKFNKILLFAQKVDTTGAVILTEDPFPFAMVTFSNTQYKRSSEDINYDSNVSELITEVGLTFTRPTSAGQTVEVSYNPDEYWRTIDSATNGTSALEYKGSILVSTEDSGVNEDSPKAKIHVIDPTADLIRFSRSQSSNMDDGYLNINADTGSVQLYNDINWAIEFSNAATEATGNYSRAHGSNVKAIGHSSTVFGESSQASGGYAMAIGTNTSADGNYSFTHGNILKDLGSWNFLKGSNITLENPAEGFRHLFGYNITHTTHIGDENNASSVIGYNVGNVKTAGSLVNAYETAGMSYNGSPLPIFNSLAILNAKDKSSTLFQALNSVVVTQALNDFKLEALSSVVVGQSLESHSLGTLGSGISSSLLVGSYVVTNGALTSLIAASASELPTINSSILAGGSFNLNPGQDPANSGIVTASIIATTGLQLTAKYTTNFKSVILAAFDGSTIDMQEMEYQNVFSHGDNNTIGSSSWDRDNLPLSDVFVKGSHNEAYMIGSSILGSNNTIGSSTVTTNDSRYESTIVGNWNVIHQTADIGKSSRNYILGSGSYIEDSEDTVVIGAAARNSKPNTNSSINSVKNSYSVSVLGNYINVIDSNDVTSLGRYNEFNTTENVFALGASQTANNVTTAVMLGNDNTFETIVGGYVLGGSNSYNSSNPSTDGSVIYAVGNSNEFYQGVSNTFSHLNIYGNSNELTALPAVGVGNDKGNMTSVYIVGTNNLVHSYSYYDETGDISNSSINGFSNSMESGGSAIIGTNIYGYESVVKLDQWYDQADTQNTKAGAVGLTVLGSYNRVELHHNNYHDVSVYGARDTMVIGAWADTQDFISLNKIMKMADKSAFGGSPYSESSSPSLGGNISLVIGNGIPGASYLDGKNYNAMVIGYSTIGNIGLRQLIVLPVAHSQPGNSSNRTINPINQTNGSFSSDSYMTLPTENELLNEQHRIPVGTICLAGDGGFSVTPTDFVNLKVYVGQNGLI